MNRINEAMRLLRVFNDKNLTYISKKTGISIGYLSEIESGNKQPTMKVIKKYAECFKINKSQILSFEEELSKHKNKISTKKSVLKFIKIMGWDK